jgi:hypothetical protein
MYEELQNTNNIYHRTCEDALHVNILHHPSIMQAFKLNLLSDTAGIFKFIVPLNVFLTTWCTKACNVGLKQQALIHPYTINTFHLSRIICMFTSTQLSLEIYNGIQSASFLACVSLSHP